MRIKTVELAKKKESISFSISKAKTEYILALDEIEKKVGEIVINELSGNKPELTEELKSLINEGIALKNRLLILKHTEKEIKKAV